MTGKGNLLRNGSASSCSARSSSSSTIAGAVRRRLKGIAATARWLHGPGLVASFQAACGIEFVTASRGGATASAAQADSGVNSPHAEPEDSSASAASSAAYESSASSSDRDSEDSGVVGVASAAVARLQRNGGGGGGGAGESRLMDSTMRNHVEYRVRNRLLHNLFMFGAMLGNEELYLTIFPYWFWNVDGFVCRRVVAVWALSMWIGQALKDLVRSPRPASPPVAKLEKRYELEYGFPSTHATIAVTIPFAGFFLTKDRYLYSWSLGFIVSFCWSLLVCLSRIYLGMHSVLDVIAGALIGAAFLGALYPWLDPLDQLLLSNPYTVYALPAALLLLCLAYPSVQRWSTARGDSTTTIAALCGVYLGSWLAYQQGLYDRPRQPPPYPVKFPDLEFFGSTAMRMALGGTVLMATRSAAKFVTYRSLCRLFRLDPRDSRNQQLLRVELPCKFVTYTLVAFNAVYTAPVLFRLIGIQRIVAFTDLNPD